MKKSIIALSFFVLFWLFSIEANDTSHQVDIDGYKEFYSLKRKEAFTAGQNFAMEDFKKGNYRILVYGLRPDIELPSERYLRERYGIDTYPIAGCIVSEGILGGADGYNTKMKALLRQKFGMDVFKEAETIIEE